MLPCNWAWQDHPLMPVPTPDEYERMFDAAAAGGYALAAVNVTSSETLNAALRGFAEAGADGIVQITTGGAAFLAGARIQDMTAGAEAFACFARRVAERSPVLVGLHTDHCPPEHLDAFVTPLLAESLARTRRGGQPLFNSHMFDGSTLDLEENLSISARLLESCRGAGVMLEVECGAVGGDEDGIGGTSGRSRLYTSSDDLLRVAEVLGTGERGRYLLAATFGNVHGVHPPGHVELRPAILRDGQQALAASRPGARFDYVFHGGSGSGEADVAAAISYGVVKVNVDSDLQYAFSRAVAEHMFENYAGVLRADGGVGVKSAYDPRSWGRRAEEAMAGQVADLCRRFGSAGKSLIA
jgi:fructose-bisphosphate aldolase, class II